MINITKSQPAPDCLVIEKQKVNGDYKCGEVLIRLKDDFYNKCYLCEEKGQTTLNVEHFVPHKGDKELMFDWNNLFWACGHCNNIKLTQENILDCTNNAIQIVDILQFKASPFPKEKVEIRAISEHIYAQNTADLLNKIYNGTTNLKKIESENMRDKLAKELKKFNDLLHEYFFEDGLDEQDKNAIKNNIRRMLQPSTSFTAFKIWIIKSIPELKNEFQGLL